MYAEFRIQHSGSDLLRRLEEVFPRRDHDVLDRSVAYAGNAPGHMLVTYSGETRNVRLYFSRSARDQIEVILEPQDDEDMRKSCEEIWRTIRRASRFKHLRLASLRLIDESDGATVARGHCGWLSVLGRRDLWTGVATAILTSVWLLVALPTFASGEIGSTVVGAIPGMAVGVGALVLLVAKRHTLLWHLEGWD
jgi:hypothetical protein